MIDIPTPIKEKLSELNKLVEQYPLTIPVIVAANFLGMDKDSLRACLFTGNCPFGVGWVQHLKSNRAFCIPTVPFYLWYTQGIGFKNNNGFQPKLM